MQKIPTLLTRDMAHPKRPVTDNVTPGCEWVLRGRGKATRKYDGTCVAHLDLGAGPRWWARREVKAGKTAPMWFEPVETDPVTGKTAGWIPVTESDFYRWFQQALTGTFGKATAPLGTYELIGEKINGNPERITGHALVRHAEAEVIDTPDLTVAGLRDLILRLHADRGAEGLVWHHPEGSSMAKLKARDFRLDGHRIDWDA